MGFQLNIVLMPVTQPAAEVGTGFLQGAKSGLSVVGFVFALGDK